MIKDAEYQDSPYNSNETTFIKKKLPKKAIKISSIDIEYISDKSIFTGILSNIKMFKNTE
jgi:hypothetical protein